MKTIKISLDPHSYKSKPKGYEIGEVSIRVGNNPVSINNHDIKKIVEGISTKGYTFAPAIFQEGLRRKENFLQMQFLALDFDNKDSNKISFEKVKDRAEKYELPILFAYETLSSTDCDKFRVVFTNDVPILDGRVATLMLDSLMTIFPEADESCKDISKMYFGGKELLYFDESIPEIDIASTICKMTLYMKDRYGDTNYKRKIAEFNKNNGIAENDKGMPDISIVDRNIAESIGANIKYKNSPNSSLLEKEVGGNLLKYYLIKYNDNTSISTNKKILKNHNEFRSPVITEIRSFCQLFQEFESNSRRLHHIELFGLATNLTKIETGNKLFLDTFRKNSYSDNRIRKYNYWEHQLKNYITGYNPHTCNGFCPYKDECHHGTNILSTVKQKYHEIERLSNYNPQYVSIEEAEEDFKKALVSAIETDIKSWYIIKAQTALGKTKTYLELLRDSTQRILIAVPTVKLKNEVCERAKAMGIDIIESPSLEEIKDELPDEIWSEIKALRDSGKHKSIHSYIIKIIKEDHKGKDILEKYLKRLRKFENFEGHAVITHRKLLSLNDSSLSKYDFVIIDEDIIFSSIITNKCDATISGLKKIRKKVNPMSDLSRKIIYHP